VPERVLYRRHPSEGNTEVKISCAQVACRSPDRASRLGHYSTTCAANCGHNWDLQAHTARELHFTERPSAQIHSDFMGAGGEIRTLDLWFVLVRRCPRLFVAGCCHGCCQPRSRLSPSQSIYTRMFGFLAHPWLIRS
jgi:hypothetical protein